MTMNILATFLFGSLIYMTSESHLYVESSSISPDTLVIPTSGSQQKNLVPTRWPILRADGRAVNHHYNCNMNAAFTEFIEEYAAAGDREKLVSCLYKYAVERGFEGMRQWIDVSGYEKVAYLVPPTTNDLNISIQAKNPASRLRWMPFHPTAYATVSVAWTKQGNLKWVILSNTTL